MDESHVSNKKQGTPLWAPSPPKKEKAIECVAKSLGTNWFFEGFIHLRPSFFPPFVLLAFAFERCEELNACKNSYLPVHL